MRTISMLMVFDPKYLGVHMDNVLCWKVQVESVCCRIQQCLYFLLRLRDFGVGQKIMLSFCSATRDYPGIWHQRMVWYLISSTEIPNCPPGTNCHEGHGWQLSSAVCVKGVDMGGPPTGKPGLDRPIQIDLMWFKHYCGLRGFKKYIFFNVCSIKKSAILSENLNSIYENIGFFTQGCLS